MSQVYADFVSLRIEADRSRRAYEAACGRTPRVARPLTPPRSGLCSDCGADISEYAYNARRCASCKSAADLALSKARYERLKDDPDFKAKSNASARAYRQKYPLACRAHFVVKYHVRVGRIPAARHLACVDCGKPATDYDHRDYTKPLEIEPTCRSCNLLRGPGYPYNSTR